MAGALHPGIASFIDSAILVAANGIRPVLPNAAVTAFTLGYTALVIGLVFAVAQAVRYIQVLLPTTGAWIAVVVPCSLYAFWRPGRRGISFWLWLVCLGIVLPIVPCGGAAVALVPPLFGLVGPTQTLACVCWNSSRSRTSPIVGVALERTKGNAARFSALRTKLLEAGM